ncbi:MAG: hypothetical protein K8T20_02215 [Planctomycetes bacterium]|nr:hypothetical protein [Planctomycetota bacterium]
MESGGNDAILSKALKDLMVHWDRTQSGWSDSARADFERDFLRDLVPAVVAAATAVQKIEEVVKLARKECS